VLPGDRVTATWTVQDVTERTTRAGRPMVVLTSGCRYEAADGGLIGEQTETLVFLAVET